MRTGTWCRGVSTDGLEARVHMRNASCTAAVALATSIWASSVRWCMRWVVVTRSGERAAIARIEVSAPVAFALPNATGRSCRLMHSCSQVEASLVDTSLVNTPLGMGFSVFVISLVV